MTREAVRGQLSVVSGQQRMSLYWPLITGHCSLVRFTRSMNLVLLRCSVGGIGRVPCGAGLGQGFIDQAGNFNALLDSFVEDKGDGRRVACLEPRRQL